MKIQFKRGVEIGFKLAYRGVAQGLNRAALTEALGKMVSID